MTPTRDDIRNTASTLAHHWTGPDTLRDREGVRRVILSHAAEVRPVLCAHVMRYLELRGFYTQAAAFEALLFDMAGIDADADERGRYVLPDHLPDTTEAA